MKKFDVFVLFLSILSILVLLIEFLFVVDGEISEILIYFDNILCIVFFLDFIDNFISAPNKLEYMKYGWIDLLSAIPNIEILRVARLVRIVKILRVIKSIKMIYDNVILKQSNIIISSLLLALLSIFISASLILQFENLPESNIKNAEDALWWSYTTITTVGYGDKFPITSEGRIVAVMLMTIGVGLFGTITASFASLLTERNKQSI